MLLVVGVLALLVAAVLLVGWRFATILGIEGARGDVQSDAGPAGAEAPYDQYWRLAYKGKTAAGFHVGEENFRMKVLNWGEPSVDCTYFALKSFESVATLKLQESPEQATFQTRLQSVGNALGIEDLTGTLDVDAIAEFVLRNFDQHKGAFRQARDSIETVYSSYLALEALKTLYGKEKAIALLDARFGKEWRKRMKRFTEMCANEDGGYGESRFRHSTVSDTDASLRLLLRWLDVDLSHEQASRAALFLMSCEGRGADGSRGFTSQPGLATTMCSAYYAFKGWENVHRVAELKATPGTPTDYTTYIRYSFHEELGGFGVSPHQDPGVVYTECAVRCLNWLSDKQLPSDPREEMDTSQIIAFLMSRQIQGGFSDDGLMTPNAHVTRSALNCLVELREWTNEPLKVPDDVFAGAIAFLLELRDGQTGGFRGYDYDFALEDQSKVTVGVTA